MNYLKYGTAITTLVLTAFLAINYFSNFSTETCSAFNFTDREVIHELVRPENFNYLDAFVHDLNKDGLDDFVITSLPAKDRRVRTPLTVILSENGIYHSVDVKGENAFFHARHVSFADLNQDGYDEILVADHGPDIAPHPGAKTGVIENASGVTFTGHLIRLPDVFNFHVTPVHVGDEVFVLQTNISPPGTPRTRLLKINLSPAFGVTEHTDLLPTEVLDSCYMSSLAVDLFSSEDEELVLGGCDQDRLESATQNDVVLKWNGQKFSLDQDAALPSRPGDPTWGTVAFNSGDLNNDGRKDIIRVTHDFGFKTGQIEVLFQREDQSFQATMPIFKMHEGVQGFIPWAYPTEGFLFFNLNTIFVPRDINEDRLQRNFLFKAQSKELENASQCLPEDLRRVYGRIVTGPNGLYLYEPSQISRFPKPFAPVL